LESSQGAHTSLITLLIPPGTQQTRVTKLLTNEIGTAANIKSTTNRKSVIDAIKSIQAKMKIVS